MCNNTEVMFHMKRQLVNTPTLYIKEKSTTQKSNIHAVELEREQMLTKDIKWQNHPMKIQKFQLNYLKDNVKSQEF